MQLYILSGLGADKRAFQNITFPGHHVTFIDWDVPEANETIDHYARRILNQITETNPVLIGLSFGGLMAMEIAKLIKTEKIILISSVKSKKEIPFYFRLAGRLKLQILLPPSLLKSYNQVTGWFFGISSANDKNILIEILEDTNPVFMKWAIDKIVNWKNLSVPQNCVHIHGTDDKILPFRFVRADIAIGNGGHLMILNRSAELSMAIQKILADGETKNS